MTAVTLPDQILEGPVPKHRQLRDVLARLAVPGEAIPSERDLTATYGVSRATVRKAIDTLVYEGLLQRTHGNLRHPAAPRHPTAPGVFHSGHASPRHGALDPVGVDPS